MNKYYIKIINTIFLSIICILLSNIACIKDTVSSDVQETALTVTINHYLITSIAGDDAGLCYLRKSEYNSDPDNWENFCADISGFEYQWGYVYSLNVLERKITDDNPDYNYLPRYEYKFITQISKEKVDYTRPENQFTLVVKTELYNWITKNNNTYYLLNKVKIDCETNGQCADLENVYLEGNGNPYTDVLKACKFIYSGDSLILLSVDHDFQGK